LLFPDSLFFFGGEYRHPAKIMSAKSVKIWQIATKLSLLAIFVTIWANPASLFAQRARFGDSFVIPNAQVSPPLIGTPPQQQFLPGALPTTQAPPTTIPALPQGVQPAIGSGIPLTGTQFQQPGTTGLPQLPQGAALGQPVLVQTQTFDPFATQPAGGGVFGTTPSTLPFSNPAFPQNPSVTPPPFIYPPPANGMPQPAQPGFYAPGQANWFNQGNGASSNSPTAWPNEMWNRVRSSEVYRLLERPRFRHTYIAPLDARYLGWNEAEIATTIAIPNFAFAAQPLRLSPGFTFNFWEGPDTAVTGVDLPARTYDAFLAGDYSSSWERQFGAELNLTVGVYSDFQEVNTDSIRITGLGLGWVRLNNTTTVKAGIEYLDRLDVKLLPAIGVFIYPTQDLKLDIYFPRPRIAQRLPNLGNYEVWAYIGGEYGGGSWTIERLGGIGDQVDVNDIRVFGGLEWMGGAGVTGFVEFGYVFDRELVYASMAAIPVPIDDSYMVRAGIAF
jgi:hypothetical protein